MSNISFKVDRKTLEKGFEVLKNKPQYIVMRNIIYNEDGTQNEYNKKIYDEKRLKYCKQIAYALETKQEYFYIDNDLAEAIDLINL